jgi:hypothetical protein
VAPGNGIAVRERGEFNDRTGKAKKTARETVSAGKISVTYNAGAVDFVVQSIDLKRVGCHGLELIEI